MRLTNFIYSFFNVIPSFLSTLSFLSSLSPLCIAARQVCYSKAMLPLSNFFVTYLFHMHCFWLVLLLLLLPEAGSARSDFVVIVFCVLQC